MFALIDFIHHHLITIKIWLKTSTTWKFHWNKYFILIIIIKANKSVSQWCTWHSSLGPSSQSIQDHWDGLISLHRFVPRKYVMRLVYFYGAVWCMTGLSIFWIDQWACLIHLPIPAPLVKARCWGRAKWHSNITIIYPIRFVELQFEV